ncbi:hypothetical protein [Pararhodobacter marinus]|uniref:hypothetical protein n=1 Tax=Pararhodobacter marinus TaxID=2184063 RepID=UPI003514DCCE
MKAVIHIGTQKTGTTTIQSFLALNRPALSSQGLRFEPFTPRNPAQMELGLTAIIRSGGELEAANKLYAMGVKGRASQEAYVDRFEAMLSKGVQTWPEHTYLASSEQIHAWCHTLDRMQALHDTLNRHFDSVRYIVYYRPQDEFMLSTYSEAIKRGEFQTLDQHIDTMLPKMNFFRRARMWASVVGQENLTVRLFDRGVMKNGDLLDDFCAVAGIDRGPLEDPPYLNQSLSAEEVDLSIRIGKWTPSRLKSGGPNPLFHAVMALKRRGLKQPGSKLVLSDAQHERIRAAHAESNERLRAQFFPDRERLFTRF